MITDRLSKLEGARRKLGILQTEERFKTLLDNGGNPVEVAVTIVTRRDGSLAFYRDGTGPFVNNRAARRSRFRGNDGHHDGSKRPTKGRVSRTEPPWKGAPLS